MGDEDVFDIEWTRENVLELSAEWTRARALLDQITALAGWLEAEPATRFARLLDAALGRDAHLNYERERRQYVCEITPEGLVPIRHDEGEPVPLPVEPAA